MYVCVCVCVKGPIYPYIIRAKVYHHNVWFVRHCSAVFWTLNKWVVTLLKQGDPTHSKVFSVVLLAFMHIETMNGPIAVASTHQHSFGKWIAACATYK